jgi:hypothetical protein
MTTSSKEKFPECPNPFGGRWAAKDSVPAAYL